jgi:SAM-dependent methyltransferase
MSAAPPLVAIACPRCGSSDSRNIMSGRDRLHGVPGTYYVSACAQCGLWFQNPRPDAASISLLYPADYRPHGEQAWPPLRNFERWVLKNEFGYTHFAQTPKPNLLRRWHGRWRAKVQLWPRFVENGLLVEIGSAGGARLAQLRDFGWSRIEGIEIAASAAEESRRRGFTVHNTSAEEGIERYADGSIDTIVTSMVAEHLLNPFAVFERVATKLKRGGELLFSTVIRDRFDARIWKTYWRSLDLPRHMVWFRERDIRQMLAPSFERVEIDYQSEPIDLTGSAAYRAGEEKHFLDSVLIRMNDRRLFYPMLALSLAGLTSRISVRAVRRA